MIEFDLHKFFKLTQFLHDVRHLIESTTSGASSLIVQRAQEILDRKLSEALDLCKGIGLELSAIQVERIKHMAKQPNQIYQSLLEPLRQLEERIQDEINVNCYLLIPQSRAGFYQKPDLFGSEVSSNFPSAAFDIEEAGKCYAAGRNTATVMHLMRVMEIGLRITAKGLGLPDPSNANWQNIIDKINSEIKQKTAAKTPDWLKVESFYSEVSAHLFAVKMAWRNPVMHVHSTYDEERALDIFNAVKGFMRHMATELKE